MHSAIHQTLHQGNLVDYRKFRRGWCFGPATFRNEVLAQKGEELGQEHFGSERYETVENRAEEIVVTVNWIADRLLLGTPGYLNRLLYLRRNPKKR